jgi:hypothetical protein
MVSKGRAYDVVEALVDVVKCYQSTFDLAHMEL